jgi:ribonuclease P protein component
MTAEPQRRNLAFPRQRRLTRPAEFLQLKTEGDVQRGRLLLLGFLAVPGETAFRAGFVTSKRVGGAVVRNRIRRRLRELVRQNQHAIRPGVWIVTIARPAAAEASHRALEDEWLRLAKRALILAP